MTDGTPFRVLNASDLADYSSWERAYNASPWREPATHPEYSLAFCRPDEEVVCLLFNDSRGSIMLPLIVRPIPSDSVGLPLRDAITPYGYGGPLMDGTPDVRRFWDCVAAWARAEMIVSLVCRLSLFPEMLAPFDGDVIHVMDNVVVDLTVPAEQRWATYEHKVRKNVQRAQRDGLRVLIDRDASRFESFLRIYHDTMDRRSAGDSFYFDRSFFERFHHRMRGAFVYAHALHGETVVSSELVLVSNSHLYSFLGGTDRAYFPMRPNDLLKHEVIRWGSEQGLTSYVLGGGPVPHDGIFRYKHAFDPGGVRPFRLGTRIFLQDHYDALLRARHEKEGHSWQPEPTFFPAYRSPALTLAHALPNADAG